MKSFHANVHIGVLMGFGWTVNEIAAHMGVSASAINARKYNTSHRGLIDTVAQWTEVGVARLVSERIRKAEEDFTERKRRLHAKGYKVVEKALNDALGDPENGIPAAPLEPIHLRAAEMGIERNEGKPLDRKAILTRNENVTTVSVDGDELDSILGEMARINEMRKSAFMLPPAGTQDAELV